jgi:16S rRNA (uracil1498-N3)-methyltransferase
LEIEQAQQAGFRVASLGPRRLRVETAAVAALTLVQHAWGDLA